MLSMVNSNQRVATDSSSATANTNSDSSSNMSGASVAHAIASLATSGANAQDREIYGARNKFSHLSSLQPQQFPIAMGDRRDNLDPSFDHPAHAASKLRMPASAAAAPKKRSTKSKCPPGLRSGKWTPEEEAYTNMIIHFFKRGLLDVEDGTSLRWYLAKRLNCEAMRVTKKLKGNSSIGKQIFRAIENTPANRQAMRRAREELAVVETRFLESLTNGGMMAGAAAMPLPSSLAVSVRGRKLLPNPKFRDGQPILAPMPDALEPPPKPEDAKLLLHFFSEAHDDEPEAEKKTEEGSLSVDLSDKLGKKRPLSSVSAPVKKDDKAKPEEDPEEPASKRQTVKMENLMD